MASSVQPTVVVIFGANGDLTWRKLLPALYNLHLDGYLPEQMAIVGMGRGTESDKIFQDKMLTGIDKFSRRGKAVHDEWAPFAQRLTFLTTELGNRQGYARLRRSIEKMAKGWGIEQPNLLFYLSVSPSLIETIVDQLDQAGLVREFPGARIVVEKPFGHDLKTARELNQMLGRVFEERQIYRIDHYLGKETVQNILAFRFANTLFEPIWNRNYIDHVQITVSEEVGLEGRGGYYEGAGALRDMIQNHLLQLLCMVCMEPPNSFNSEEVRGRKVDVLRAIRKFKPEEVSHYAVRGQYASGWMKGQAVPGYREEPRVTRDSRTETYAAVMLFVDNWRWQGVPFYIRTGKRMSEKVSTITVQFKPAPLRIFPTKAAENLQSNALTFSIYPSSAIRLRIQSKQPGLKMYLNPVDLEFDYRDAYVGEPPEAYETLLLDALRGDPTLFMRADQVEAAWEIITPILDAWGSGPAPDFPNYSAGTWGPPEADALIARDGHHWLGPLLKARELEPPRKRVSKSKADAAAPHSNGSGVPAAPSAMASSSGSEPADKKS